MTKESRKCLRLKSQKKYSILLLFYFYFTHFCEEVMKTLVEIEWDVRFWLRIPKEKWNLLSLNSGPSCCEATLLFPCTPILPVDEIYCIYNLFIDLLLQQQYRYCFFTTHLYCFNFSSLPMFFSSSQYKPAPQRYDHRPNSSDPPLSGPGLGPAVLWLFHLQDVMVRLNMEKLLTWDP